MAFIYKIIHTVIHFLIQCGLSTIMHQALTVGYMMTKNTYLVSTLTKLIIQQGNTDTEQVIENVMNNSEGAVQTAWGV